MSENNSQKSFYITTTIPYVNADPHIGFAFELVQSDVIARYQRSLGKDVFFSTGTDEYGQKIWEASQKEGKSVRDYVDYYAQKFIDLKCLLNLSNDSFIRTTSEQNIRAAQEFWRLCESNGDIYKRAYKGLYCVGCEKFITEKDVVDGRCSLHPNKDLEIVEEENYFFKLTKYREKILEYLSREGVVLPEWRRREAIELVHVMEDFSVSRNSNRISWGIAIPGDNTQVMYVWFGAFVNYISTLGWPNDKKNFEKFWVNGETIQTAGKDMVKFQSVMWQGMLLSAGLPATNTVIYHGFVTGEGGVKMSKSLGNVVDPADIVSEYGTDALRYFFLREMSPFEDSPFSLERFKDAYNANLANGLGNLVSRVMRMATANGVSLDDQTLKNFTESEIAKTCYEKQTKAFEEFNLQKASDAVWEVVSLADKYIQDNQPFKTIKVDKEKGESEIKTLLAYLDLIATALLPLLPETASKISNYIKTNTMPEAPLFARKD